jgi:hypothetical protein
MIEPLDEDSYQNTKRQTGRNSGDLRDLVPSFPHRREVDLKNRISRAARRIESKFDVGL